MSSIGTAQRMTTGRRRGLLLRRVFDLARELVDVGRHEVGHAHPDQIAQPPRGDVHHAVGRLLPVQLGQRAEGLRELVAARDRVEERRVHRVHAVVLDLEPVARQRELARGHQPVARQVEGVVEREGRLLLGRPHVGEDEPAELVHRVRALAKPILERARRGLARRLEDAAVHVVVPAVVAAADAVLARSRPYSSDVPRCAQWSWSNPTRPALSRKTTRSSPMMRMRSGVSFSSRAKATGCQKRRRYSPHGVPGPTRVSSSSGGGTSRAK